MEGIDLFDADVREDLALVAPVHLGLGPWDDLEAAVQPAQFVRPDAQLGRDARPGLLQIELDALVVAGEAILLDQTLMHHRALDQQFCSQHRVDQGRHLGNHPRLRSLAAAAPRRARRSLRGEVLAHGLPVQTRLPGDLRDAHRTRRMQSAKTPQLRPAFLIQDH